VEQSFFEWVSRSWLEVIKANEIPQNFVDDSLQISTFSELIITKLLAKVLLYDLRSSFLVNVRICSQVIAFDVNSIQSSDHK
jgi:hypothetical protein